MSLRKLIVARRQWALRLARRKEGPNLANMKLLGSTPDVLNVLVMLTQEADIDIVKGIMLVERTDTYSLHAKSAWTGAALHIGWYVGYVTTVDNIWLFAMNMDMEAASQAPLRHDITIQALQALDII